MIRKEGLMIPKHRIELIVPDKYFDNPTEEPIIGLIRYLREQGKACEFLGFNRHPSKLQFSGFTAWSANYVILIDGIKYYGGVSGQPDINYCATFFVVGDEEHDYILNHLNKRVSQILETLEDR